MKKNLFLFFATIFLCLFFWQFSTIDLSLFNFNNLVLNLFQLNPLFLKKAAWLLGLWGGYLICLIFFGYMVEQTSSGLSLSFLVLILLLYLVEAPLLIWLFMLTFYLLSLLVLSCAQNTQNQYLKIHFGKVSYHCMHTQVFYLALFCAIISFGFQKEQIRFLPEPVLQILENQIAKHPDLFINTELCKADGMEQTLCLAQLEEARKNFGKTLSSLDLEKNFNQKMLGLLDEYAKWFPFLLALLFFTLVYSLLSLFAVLFALLGNLLYQALRLSHFFEVDLRNASQEYLK